MDELQDDIAVRELIPSFYDVLFKSLSHSACFHIWVYGLLYFSGIDLTRSWGPISSDSLSSFYYENLVCELSLFQSLAFHLYVVTL